MIFRLFIAFAFIGSAARSATWPASASQSSIATVIAAGTTIDGDTVSVAAGTITDWTSTLTVTKAITLQGAGVGQTIIEDNAATAVRLMTVQLATDKVTRITGIEFTHGARSAWYDGIITLEGPSNQNAARIRIDHCKFDDLFGFMIRSEGALGVIDHNEFLFTHPGPPGTSGNYPLYIYHRNWNGQAHAAGSWTAATNLGTEEFLFIEDNTLSNTSSQPFHDICIDAYAGARYVFRHNIVNRASVEAHGTESAGRERGTRAVEIYGNSFIGSDQGAIVANIRSGTGVVYNNTITGFMNPPLTPGPSINLHNHRMFFPFAPWGVSDGTSVWDKNVAGGPFASATATGGGTLTVTSTGAGWTVNQWVDYSVKKTSGGTGGSYIISNTSDTLTYSANNGYGVELSFSAGNTFEIWKVDESMDQPGRTGGSLITEDTPSLPAGWNDQTDDALYAWNNIRDGTGDTSVVFAAGQPSIRVNEHFFNGTAKPGYTAYTYPDPLIAATEGATNTLTVSGNLNVGELRFP